MSFVPYDKKEEQTTAGMPTIQPSGTDEEECEITGDRDMEFEPAWTSTRAPPGEFTVWDEAVPTRDLSRIVYTLTDLLDKEKLTLKMPDDFPFPDFGQNKESIDLTQSGREGMSFFELDQIIEENRDAIYEVEIPDEQDIETVKRLREDLGDEGLKKIFLTHHRHMQQKHACVYSIIKDTIEKRIIVSFRGSVGGRDWPTNLKILSENMWTPDRIRHLMDEKLKENVLVHKGFFDYLFNNQLMDKGKQRFDQIIDDMRKNLDPGYRIYVTGHSLGGALATVFSVKLAGAGHKFDDIPRPITCITWAAPHNGTADYRTAVENLEKQGSLRLLRIYNNEDIVPALCGFLIFRPRQLKQVGIGVRMYAAPGVYHLEHSSRANFRTFLRNLIFKPIWFLTHWHGLFLHHQRFFNGEDKWKNTKLDDLYKDETIVSPEFLAGKTW